ncbi:uncharacterized protein LOC135842645 [Planococcus citri]|uniref:uncharacterized protein LOC135842645 n=1 Tax=Planococcus citri TaxID=170843 RepID=UPI0031F8DCD0
MKKLLWIYAAICCISVIIQAAAEENADDGGLNIERDAEDTADDSDDPFRIKRQHGHGGSNPITSLLSSVFNKKLGLIGSLSSISSSSKGVETHHHTYDYPHPPPVKPFDWWSFKKTILASLLQAVKAITGGVIALNGQLVKVKGHLLAAKGALLSTKGDSITNFGKHLATNAFGHHQPAHSDIHEASLPAPASGATASGYGLTGPSNIHGSLETGYPNNDFKSAIEYPSGYYKDPNSYAKRAAPAYFLVDNNTADKSRK